jgi:hypothetical protein
MPAREKRGMRGDNPLKGISMISKHQIAAGLFCLGLGLTASVAATAAAPPPSAGFYAASGYFVSATPAKACEPYARAGDTTVGIFYYPGPDADGATYRQVGDATATEIGIAEYPKRPKAGVYKQSGTSEQGVEGGTLTPATYTYTITPLSADSFTLKAKLVFAVSASATCTENQNFVMIKSGIN